MLNYFLFPLAENISLFNVFRYISFRSFGAAITALLLSLLVGPWFIRKLQKMSFGQVVREEGPSSHHKKSGTPTMGGALILFALTVATVFWIDLSNINVWIILFVTLTYGLIGWVDDYRKIVLKNTVGLTARQKLFGQFLIAGITAYLFIQFTDVSPELRFPFFKNLTIEMGWLYIPFVMLVIVGSSNAVNLTDGLDGLAIGTLIVSVATFMILAYVTGHVKFADYLGITYVKGMGEVAVLCAAIAAAGMGFLWFNAYPAQVFMGDVGSLALGGTIGALAVATKNEILLVIIGGIYVVETLSVIIQVYFYKTKGRRIFRMAPIHHHFELKGIPESKIVIRFWIISILLAILALSTLKLR